VHVVLSNCFWLMHDDSLVVVEGSAEADQNMNKKEVVQGADSVMKSVCTQKAPRTRCHAVLKHETPVRGTRLSVTACQPKTIMKLRDKKGQHWLAGCQLGKHWCAAPVVAPTNHHPTHSATSRTLTVEWTRDWL
jgi:hypothetical protein